MRKNLEAIGLTDTPANNQKIIDNLLETGNSVTADNRRWVSSTLEGPNGKLKVEST
jgi:hypothetical protein